MFGILTRECVGVFSMWCTPFDAGNCCTRFMVFFIMFKGFILSCSLWYNVQTYDQSISENLTWKKMRKLKWCTPQISVQHFRSLLWFTFICQQFKSIKLYKYKTWSDVEVLAFKICSYYTFLPGVILRHDILYEVNHTNKVLQEVGMKIEQSVHQLNARKDFIVKYCSDKGFPSILIHVKELISKLEIKADSHKKNIWK